MKRCHINVSIYSKRQGHLVTTASLVVRGCWMSGRQNHERAEQVIIKSTRKISESQLSLRVF